MGNIMVEKFLTSSKQALPEKRMAQDNYSIAFFFFGLLMCINNYGKS